MSNAVGLADRPRTSHGGPCLPNLLIIGARKAGTTALHHYLSLHPQIHMSRQKELSFFDARNRWKLGVQWYKSNFDSSYLINGESSPQYARFPMTSGVPERIKRVLGQPKLIYMVRDPVERIRSDYVQIVDWKPWTAPFAELLPQVEHDPEEYIQGSSYYLQISQYLEHFPRENILVVLQERLNRNREGELKRIFEYLGVDHSFWSAEFNKRHNLAEEKHHEAGWFKAHGPEWLKREIQSPKRIPWRITRAAYAISRMGAAKIEKPRMSEADDLKLQALLRDDVLALRRFLDDPLSEWRPYR